MTSTTPSEPWRALARKMFGQGMRTQAIAPRLGKTVEQVIATCRG